jgi:hypothetical protein
MELKETGNDCKCQPWCRKHKAKALIEIPGTGGSPATIITMHGIAVPGMAAGLGNPEKQIRRVVSLEGFDQGRALSRRYIGAE